MDNWKSFKFHRRKSFKNVTIKYENSEEEQDTVISADKFGLIKRSDEITILVSRGPEPIEPQTIILISTKIIIGSKNLA